MVMLALHALVALCLQGLPPGRAMPTALDAHKAAVASALRARGSAPAPIPLQPGSDARGVMFDRFRLLVLAATEAARTGMPLTPEAALRLDTPWLIVVANPVDCAGASVVAASITVLDERKQDLATRGEVLRGEQLGAALPGVLLRDGAAGMAFTRQFSAKGSVVIRYAGLACDTDRIELPLSVSPPRKTVDVPPTWPAEVARSRDAGPVRVHIRGTIEIDGTPANLDVATGPSPFNLAAIAAVRQWRYDPMRINGVPTPVPLIVSVSFRTR